MPSSSQVYRHFLTSAVNSHTSAVSSSITPSTPTLYAVNSTIPPSFPHFHHQLSHFHCQLSHFPVNSHALAMYYLPHATPERSVWHMPSSLKSTNSMIYAWRTGLTMGNVVICDDVASVGTVLTW